MGELMEKDQEMEQEHTWCIPHIHLDEEMRRKEEIQLLEGAGFSFPLLRPAFASMDDIGFELFPFPTTPGENEVDGTFVLLNT